MASCRPSDRDAGYATAAAALTALAIALVATAVMQASVTSLRRARIEYDRARTEAALDGAQTTAVSAVLNDGGERRLRWEVQSAIGSIEVLAEPERPKLALVNALQGRAADLAVSLPIADVDGLLKRLRAVTMGGGGALDLYQADGSVIWRRCGASVLSPYGQGGTVWLAAASAPKKGRFSWRAGEVWRIRAIAPSGQSDERIVRFTGDPLTPAAVVERRASRGEGRGEPCANLIAGA